MINVKVRWALITGASRGVEYQIALFLIFLRYELLGCFKNIQENKRNFICFIYTHLKRKFHKIARIAMM